MPHGDQRVNLQKKFPLKNKSTIMGMGFNIYLQVVFISIRIFGSCFPLAPRSSRTTATVPIRHAVIKIKILLPACILKIAPISLLLFLKKQKHAHFRVRHLELYWDARDWALKFHSKECSNWLQVGKNISLVHNKFRAKCEKKSALFLDSIWSYQKLRELIQKLTLMVSLVALLQVVTNQSCTLII